MCILRISSYLRIKKVSKRWQRDQNKILIWHPILVSSKTSKTVSTPPPPPPSAEGRGVESPFKFSKRGGT